MEKTSALIQGKRETSPLHLLVLCSGMAALSWTVVWQIQASLALGVSSWGTALTLAVTMAGMCVGALLAGQMLKSLKDVNGLRIYGTLELLIGLSGLFLMPALHFAEQMDTAGYRMASHSEYWVHVLGIALSMGFPAICMGATTPVFGLAARQFGTSISILYGLNTLGAALGCILAAFFFIPSFGVMGTINLIAAVNFIVGLVAILMGRRGTSEQAEKQKPCAPVEPLDIWQEYLLVFVTGFATLALEVAWFRSFTAAFWSTTAAFSIMLSSVLVSLGIAAQLVPVLRRKGASLSVCMALAGIFILLATPLVERFDMFARMAGDNPATLFVNWFIMAFYVTVLPITFLGLGLPWILERQTSTARWAAFYGFNTLAAVLGSLVAGWIFLPAIGFARTSWIIGAMVTVTGLMLMRRASSKSRKKLAFAGLAALILAIAFESGVGRTRIQFHASKETNKDVNILASAEGPDATVSVIELREKGERVLIIDGFVTTSERGVSGSSSLLVQYMLWMGHLPMLLHPDPKEALVICFGTGQTANALRRENPKSLTIVDINPNVFKMAHYFTSNENVLKDPRVRNLVMDGRAFMRRTEKTFDVITLEPMPPTFAGVNALYSKEFYQLARERMSDNGIIAQWLPFHLVSAYHGASVSRTFTEVFPNAVLWIDPESLTGILLGSKNDRGTLGSEFPGFKRNDLKRILPEETVRKAVYLEKEGLKRYGEQYGDVITDDNQLLAYGAAAFNTHVNPVTLLLSNYDTMKIFRKGFYEDKGSLEIEQLELIKKESERKE